ncbi:Hypothetical protein GLP15_1008 [Giardia lamblia P15]|uniref:Uncharacterized protein n=1 Tax=Giardia intestinalis (strain P15) TaxID=658858 RepID=E1F324_GIAIA|nr:Hypothetical protein GLP15_1008 [Giardia lamblia P15]
MKQNPKQQTANSLFQANKSCDNATLSQKSATEARKMLANERLLSGQTKVDADTRAAVKARISENRNQIQQTKEARAAMTARIDAMAAQDRERRRLAFQEDMRLEASLNVRHQEIRARLNKRIAHASTVDIANFMERQQGVKQTADTATISSQDLAHTIKSRAAARRAEREKELLEKKQEKARNIAFIANSKAASPSSSRPQSSRMSATTSSADKSVARLTLEHLERKNSDPNSTYDKQLMRRFDDLEESSDVGLPEVDVLHRNESDQIAETSSYADHRNRAINVVDDIMYLTTRYQMEREDKVTPVEATLHQTKYKEYAQVNKKIIWANCARDVDDLISLALELATSGPQLSAADRTRLTNAFLYCEHAPDKEYKDRIARIRELLFHECELYKDDIPCDPSDIELMHLIETMSNNVFTEVSVGFTKPNDLSLDSTRSTQFVNDTILSIPPCYRNADASNTSTDEENTTENQVVEQPGECDEGAEKEPQDSDKGGIQKLTFLSTIESVIHRLKSTDYYLHGRDTPFLFSNLQISIPTSSGLKVVSGHDLPLLTLFAYNPKYISADAVESLAASAADYLGATPLLYVNFVSNFADYKKEFTSYATVLQKLTEAEKQIKSWKKETNDPIRLTLELRDQYACICDYKDADRILKLLNTPYKTEEPPDMYIFTLMYMRAYYLLKTHYSMRIVSSPIIDSVGNNLILSVDILAPEELAIASELRPSSHVSVTTNGSPLRSEVHFSATSVPASAASKRAAGLTSLLNSSYLFVVPLKATTVTIDLETAFQPINTLRHQIYTTINDAVVPQLPQNPPKGALISSVFDSIIFITCGDDCVIKPGDEASAKKRDPKKDPPPSPLNLDELSPWQWSKFSTISSELVEDPDYSKLTSTYSAARGYLQLLVDTAETSGDAQAPPQVSETSATHTSRTQTSRTKEGKPESKGSKPDLPSSIRCIPVLKSSPDMLTADLKRCYSDYLQVPCTQDGANTCELPTRNMSVTSPSQMHTTVPTDSPLQKANQFNNNVDPVQIPEEPTSQADIQAATHDALESVVPITQEKIESFFEDELEAKSSAPTLEGILFKCFRKTRVPQDLAFKMTERQLINRASELIEGAVTSYKNTVSSLVPKLNNTLRMFSLHFVNMRTECIKVCKYTHNLLIEELCSQFSGFSKSSTAIGAALESDGGESSAELREKLGSYVFQFRTMLDNTIHDWRHSSEQLLYEKIYTDTEDDTFRAPIELVSETFDTFATTLNPGIKQLQNIPSSFFYYDIHTKYKFMRPMGALFNIYQHLAENYDDTLREAETLYQNFESLINKAFNQQIAAYILEKRTEPIAELSSYTEMMSNLIFNIFKDLVYASVELFGMAFYALTNIIHLVAPANPSRQRSARSKIYNVKTFIKTDMDYTTIRDERYNLDTYFEDFYYGLISNLNYKNLFDVASLQSAHILLVSKNEIADLIQIMLENFHVFLNTFIKPNGDAMMNTLLHAFSDARTRCDNVICDQYLSTLNSVRLILAELLEKSNDIPTLLKQLPQTALTELRSQTLQHELILLETLKPLLSRSNPQTVATLFMIADQKPLSYYQHYIDDAGPFSSCSAMVLQVDEFCIKLKACKPSPFVMEYGEDCTDLLPLISVPEDFDSESLVAAREQFSVLVRQASSTVSWNAVFSRHALECLSDERKRYNELVEAAASTAKGKKPVDLPETVPSNDCYIMWPMFIVRNSFIPLDMEEFSNMVNLTYDTLGIDRDSICTLLPPIPVAIEQCTPPSTKQERGSRAPSPVKDMLPDPTPSTKEVEPAELPVLFKNTQEYALLYEVFSNIFTRGPYNSLPSGPFAEKLALNTNLSLNEYNKLFRVSFINIFANLLVKPSRILEFIIQILLCFCYTDESIDDSVSEEPPVSPSRATQSLTSARSTAVGKARDTTPDTGKRDTPKDSVATYQRTFSPDVSNRVFYLFGLSSMHHDNIKTGRYKYYRNIKYICSLGLHDVLEESIFSVFAALDYTTALQRLRSEVLQKLSEEMEELVERARSDAASAQKEKGQKQAPSRAKK